MYIFTSDDKNVLSDTFLSWYDNGKSNDFLITKFTSIGQLMLYYYDKVSEIKNIIQVNQRYFEIPETEFGFTDRDIIEVDQKHKMKIVTEWEKKE